MMEEPEENRLDHSLREKFEDFSLEPSAPVWARIEQRLPGPAPEPKQRWPLPLPLLFGLVALLAGLGGWLLRGGLAHTSNAERVVALRQQPASSARHTPQSVAQPLPAPAQLAPNASRVAKPVAQGPVAAPVYAFGGNAATVPASPSALTTKGYAKKVLAASPALVAAFPLDSTTAPGGSKVAVGTSAAAANSVPTSTETMPATLRQLATLERQVLVLQPNIFMAGTASPTAENRAELLTTLRAERAELFRLQRRTDSVLLALGDVPGAPTVVAAPAAAPDTALPRPRASRWSVLLTATPEQNTLTLQGPEGDSLTALRRNHETGRAGLSAALLAEYRLTPRLSVGGGVGYSSVGADLRITNKVTDISVVYDSTTTHTVNVYTSTSQTHSVRIVQVPQLSPVFNGNGQVIRYDTVYVPRRDTVFTTIFQHDTVRSTRKVLTPLITKKESLQTKLLQPTYRFFTVPVQLRYRLTMGPGRWWADVAAGAQFQFFLGGTQVVTNDGENFRTETVTASNGPFRRLNLALTGSLALNYALTNRLSVSVAPSMRWQALSLYKPGTGLVQQPTATGLLFGLRFGL